MTLSRCCWEPLSAERSRMTNRLEEYLNTPCFPGTRNNALFLGVLLAREAGWDESTIRCRLADKASLDGLNPSEIENTINSAMRREITPSEKQGGTGRELAWDSVISYGPTIAPSPRVAPPPSAIPQPRPQWESKDLPLYLKAVFGKKETICVCVNSQKAADGRVHPASAGRHYGWNELQPKCVPAQDIVGSKDAAGAWVRVNPTDGKGGSIDNITVFRHCLLESDEMPVERQWETISRLRVPCSAVVHSGGKSLHFLVRVGPVDTLEEYRRRVKELYRLLTAQGFEACQGNKDPGRYSRLPGVPRQGKPQYLVAEHIGLDGWEEWVEFMNGLDDGLPLIECMADVLKNPPALAPVLIEGVLYKGHKMLISAPSKAGKSFNVLELAAAITKGGDWLGYKCAQGRILYVNLEIDRGCFWHHRYLMVMAYMHGDHLCFHHWPLRGHGGSLDALSAHLYRHAWGRSYDCIIFDPLYKVYEGMDENDAGDVARFCNKIDRIADRLGAAVVLVSHFSKGAQGGKYSMDRTSGSGVFSRDPDTVLTLTHVEDEDGEVQGLEGEWVLRNFASPPKFYMRFEYPIHVLDPTLAAFATRGSKKEKRQAKAKAKKPAAKQRPQWMLIQEAVLFLGGKARSAALSDVSEFFGVKPRTMQQRIGKAKGLRFANGIVYVED